MTLIARLELRKTVTDAWQYQEDALPSHRAEVMERLLDYIETKIDSAAHPVMKQTEFAALCTRNLPF